MYSAVSFQILEKEYYLKSIYSEFWHFQSGMGGEERRKTKQEGRNKEEKYHFPLPFKSNFFFTFPTILQILCLKSFQFLHLLKT